MIKNKCLFLFFFENTNYNNSISFLTKTMDYTLPWYAKISTNLYYLFFQNSQVPSSLFHSKWFKPKNPITPQKMVIDSISIGREIKSLQTKFAPNRVTKTHTALNKRSRQRTNASSLCTLRSEEMFSRS